jgi:chemotaxis regulatin CheY-phosphate phosphatase CheZ
MTMSQGSTQKETSGGERVARDLVQLIREIVPLLENVRHSIEESTSHIPKASKQLSNVTQATENATVEILNLLEAMSDRIAKVEGKAGEIKQNVAGMQAVFGTLVQAVEQLPEKDRAGFGEALTAAKRAVDDGTFVESCRSVEEMLAKTKEDSMSIAISLQVQDITSQQIAGVANIIESVRTQLAGALFRFENGTDAVDLPDENQLKGKVFDTNAEYTKAPERQSEADEIVRLFSGSAPQ